MSCTFNNGNEVLEKVRAKGFSNDAMDFTYNLECDCGTAVEMKTFETKCPNCGGMFVVTPCSQDSIDNISFVK